MSQSFVSVACAGLLLAAAAFTASESVGQDAATHARPPTHAVHVFVIMREAGGKGVVRPGVRVEGDDAVDIAVGADGAKLSLPVDAPAAVRVLFPGGNCSVTLNPASVASGRVTILVDRTDAGATCSIGAAVAQGKAASSAASATSVPSAHGQAAVTLLDRLF